MKVTPKVLADTYAVTGNAPSVVRGKTSHQAVAEFQGQYMSKDDLTSFFTNISPPGAKAGDDQVAKFVGVDYKKGSGVEALLDIEYIMGVAPGVATEFWEWPGMDFCGDLMKFTTELLASNVTVMSISYGYQGDVSRLGCKDAELKTVDANFAKLAAKGTSLMISSGDSGSGYTGGLFSTKLYPSWPASSPWVTAVGATTFIDNQIGNTQKASAQFGSGGGFSAMFTQDDAPWQKDLVAAYVAKGDSLAKWPTTKDKVDFTGRATPDVAALGEGYQVWVGSRFESVGGTSASSPAFAGYVSLLNEARRQAGKPNMGFLNPFLYQNAASGFTDIVNGTNAIARSGLPVKAGYACAAGWDAATGLGVPKFDKLLAAALALETAAIVEAA
jgi:tripeptidyl-peptidase-1